MPFKSKAQRRAMWAKAKEGKIPKDTVREWERKTKNMESLPEKKEASLYRHSRSKLGGSSALDTAALKQNAKQTSPLDGAGAVGAGVNKINELIHGKPMGFGSIGGASGGAADVATGNSTIKEVSNPAGAGAAGALASKQAFAIYRNMGAKHALDTLGLEKNALVGTALRSAGQQAAKAWGKSKALGAAAKGGAKELGSAAKWKADDLGRAAASQAKYTGQAATSGAKNVGHSAVNKSKELGRNVGMEAKNVWDNPIQRRGVIGAGVAGGAAGVATGQ